MDTSSIAGQVCDRCRTKKIKCDGALPSCSPCSMAGVFCEVSAKLRRKTKIRGFSASNNSQIDREKLEQENALLKRQLQSEIENSQALQAELERLRTQLTASNRPTKSRKLGEHAGIGGQSPGVSISGASELSGRNRSAFVIKHMGRMVIDHANVGRFAGSTTGVHFVSSMERLCRQHVPTLKPFPDDCFRLHIVPFQSVNPQSSSWSTNLASVGLPTQVESASASSLFPQPAEFYMRQLDNFNDMWLAFCPVVPRDKFARDLKYALDTLYTGHPVDGRTGATFQVLTMITLFNELLPLPNDNDTVDVERTQRYLDFFCQLHHQVIALANLESLQALVLLSCFLHISGQTSWLIQVNGIQVRLAQSLGMHRHAQRFRFTESETELRKRLWWSVYCFDMLTSIVHGLPKLINDIDVDNDLPIDCELRDTDTAGFSHLLPGEPSPVSLYIQYIRLCKILSAVLGQLYTTSQRRGGEEKIARLDRELRVWYQNFNSTLQTPCDANRIDRILHKARCQRFGENELSMIAWLDVMTHFALVLIHRPALTFDDSTRQFRESLSTCLTTCSTILQLASLSNVYQRTMSYVPFGPSLVFQCALMHAYPHCGFEIAAPVDGQRLDKSAITRAIHLLSELPGMSCSHILHYGAMVQAISLLEFLLATLPEATARLDNSSPAEPVGLDESLAMSYSGLEDPDTTIPWDSSALESLNHLDIIYGDWEAPSHPGTYDAG